MKKRNNMKGIMFNKNFMDLPEIETTIEKLKAPGFAVTMALLERLLYRKNAIGILSATAGVARKLGMHRSTLIDIVRKSAAFKVDEQRGLFWAPCLRKMLRLSASPSQEDLDDIIAHGNIFYGDEGNSENDTSEAENNADTDAENISSEASNHTDAPSQNEVYSGNKTDLNRKQNRKLALQHADNQQKHTLYIIKDKNISHKNKEIVSNKGIRKQVSSFPCDDDDSERFKEILSLKSWRISVHKRMDMDLGDEQTLGIFSEWMYDYCVTMQKRLKNSADVRIYAGNLLRLGTKTRKEFDKFLEEKIRNKCAAAEKTRSQYESICMGIRYSNVGQVIPADAPEQTDPEQKYSYIQERWIPRDDYHKSDELKCLKMKKLQNPDYVLREKGAA